MKLVSTRGGDAVSAAEAIVKGIADNGGLFVPESFPKLDISSITSQYLDVAYKVMSLYLDIEEPVLKDLLKKAYASFDTEKVTPVESLNDTESILELWHGPTMAFKDVALQMLPHLLTDSLKRTNRKNNIYILVATSGDTGKAALEGFRDVDGTRVLVFYPDGGVSKAQRLQMVTQEGKNVDVCAVKGNFDDAQTGVKKIFASKEIREELEKRGYSLSSANSINFGRLLPQIVYYFVAYADLVKKGTICLGDKINFCVPTGNFGDILAGYYAFRMGLPINKLLCASNRNNVLTDFFQTGTYDSNRMFYKSMSCSIDILISSNLERLVFESSGRNTEVTIERMQKLKDSGVYTLTNQEQKEISDLFEADWCSEEDTLQTIKEVYDSYHYLMDPHTAVAQTMYERYQRRTGDTTHTVILSTANPYKFATSVLSAFEKTKEDDFVNAERLHSITNISIPDPLLILKSKPERHLGVCELSEMPKRVVSGVD